MASEPIEVPRESYLTFQEFLNEKSSDTLLKSVPADWLALTFKPPLLGKYKINDFTILSISKFTGPIGNELSNINRWRSQINLDPIYDLKKAEFKKSSNSNVVKREIEISNGDRTLFIFWITEKETHFFVKVETLKSFDIKRVRPFVESQSWQNI
ncbi:MAG: hypothetical protein VW397_04090 [Candidatus Margulisiibacteriota bacterium]